MAHLEPKDSQRPLCHRPRQIAKVVFRNRQISSHVIYAKKDGKSPKLRGNVKGIKNGLTPKNYPVSLKNGSDISAAILRPRQIAKVVFRNRQISSHVIYTKKDGKSPKLRGNVKGIKNGLTPKNYSVTLKNGSFRAKRFSEAQNSGRGRKIPKDHFGRQAAAERFLKTTF
jgi:hypothetical protein